MVASSAFSLLPQPTDCAPHSHSTSSVQSVGTACLDFPTVLAAPNANSFPLHRILPAKFAEIFAMLTNLHLLNLLPQTGTITGTILSNDSGLLRTLGLHQRKMIQLRTPHRKDTHICRQSKTYTLSNTVIPHSKYSFFYVLYIKTINLETYNVVKVIISYKQLRQNKASIFQFGK